MSKIEPINTRELDAPFETHLSDPENRRIVFSGRFGSGKTTYLRHFFERNKAYDVFHLFPVNYQVENNADIFKLIKYDILIHLIQKQYLNKNTPQATLKKIGIGLSSAKDTLVSIFDKIPIVNIKAKILSGFAEAFYNAYKTPTTDKGIAQKFLSTIKNKEGVYNQDEISEIIKFTISEKKGEKGSVLVIDDLDRLDPEHIFRILNVFSAHFDTTGQEEEENKFGFDKIIVVCDIDNIHKIFSAKYGQSCDFSGYIDKFFSKEVFEFDVSGLLLTFVLANTPKEGLYQDSFAKTMSHFLHPMIMVKKYTFRNHLKFLELFELYKNKSNNIIRHRGVFIRKVPGEGNDIVNSIVTFNNDDFVVLYNQISLLSAVLGGSSCLNNILEENSDKISILTRGCEKLIASCFVLWMCLNEKVEEQQKFIWRQKEYEIQVENQDIIGCIVKENNAKVELETGRFPIGQLLYDIVQVM